VHVAVPCEVAISSLTHLDIRGCARVTDALLFAVAEGCQALQTFNVFRENGITEAGARALLEGCTLLRETDVQYAYDLDRELRLELVRRRCFTKLHIDGEVFGWADMDGQLLSDILSVSPTIKILDFQELLWLTEDALAMCAPHCRVIEERRLNQCNEITAEGVAQVLMRAGSRIRSIHIIDCPQLGDDFALAVAQHCPQIRELILSAAGVTDVSVALLATQCSHLRVLSLYECMSVSMPGCVP
jgi:hypothetical protein